MHLAALRALGLGKLRHRDQAATLLEAVAPHESVELVGAGVVHRFGLERLTRLALQRKGEPPGHAPQLALGNHQAGIAGVHLGTRVPHAADIGLEQAGNLVACLGHPVEIAHPRSATASAFGQQRLRQREREFFGCLAPVGGTGAHLTNKRSSSDFSNITSNSKLQLSKSSWECTLMPRPSRFRRLSTYRRGQWMRLS